MGNKAMLTKSQTVGKVLLLIVAGMSIVLRIRKMMHYSMIGEEPTGMDWYMVVLWLVVMIFVLIELASKKSKTPRELNGYRMKVSRKTYRDKQNQATGPLVVAGLAFLMLCYNSYMILFEHKKADWDTYIWFIMFPLLLITWRIRENKLKKLEVEE